MSNTRRVALAERYVATHPAALAFTREATPEERRLLSLPLGSVCRVVKMGVGYAHTYTMCRRESGIEEHA